ncbi:MAG: RluA family pseudouridine synthase [Oscillospiraceae bacterium]|nr:RluA family pseudouridine synthase [Oscillospiraceae bacterium]
MKEYTVEKNDAGQRLDRFAAKTVPLLPSSLLQKYIRLKRIKLCGKGAKRDTRLCEGDTVQFYINDEFFDTPKAENAYLTVSAPKLEIVYEDENILLVDKQPGQAVHPHDGAEYGKTLIDHIQAYLYAKGEWKPREENTFAPALCNRIDRNTGGIVIAAKNAEAMRILNEKIRDRELEKQYLCVTVGKMNPPAGTIACFLLKNEKKNLVSVYHKPVPGAKTAITHYKTVRSKGELSLVQVTLETGRTHQIRASFADRGCPLLGDGKYGIGAKNRAYGETRQCLYAYRLTFSFQTDAGILNGLKDQSFEVRNVPFRSKYFN